MVILSLTKTIIGNENSFENHYNVCGQLHLVWENPGKSENIL